MRVPDGAELTDEDVPAFWAGLGLPGLADIHVHFLPPRMLAKVWSYFDNAEEHYGATWPVHYRYDEAERLTRLRALGVRGFPALAYPHKPGMAAWLNDWTLDFAERVEDCVPSATFYPDEDALSYVAAALDRGARIFKVHVQVGGFDPRLPVLDPVWGLLAEAGVPVVTHCGSGPLPGAFTGPAAMEQVLRRHPSLRLVIAHLGFPEYAEFVRLVTLYPRVVLDTTMAFTEYFQSRAPVPPEVLRQLADLGDRVVLGSDFPNIPYPYAHQIESLARLDFGDDWLRAVLWHNGAKLMQLT
ncbi:MAG TPA: amidohydrolase family protein [Mycobacteriales bacterium]|nr:amidohydrolase family protein [Mycobacteriales bacterium]